MMPGRIQLKRTKGWRMPPNTVKVDRTTPFGNPFPKPAKATGEWRGSVVAQFAEWLANTADGQALQVRARAELAGKNLACWCPPGPCHADIWLKVVNGDHLRGDK
jgi:hypothetical protein